MTDKDDWMKEKNLENSGIDLKPPAVRLHGSNETPKHLAVKAMIALVLQDAGRRWDTEVEIGDAGRADVVDLGEPDDSPVVYEVETGATPKAVLEKAEQYTDGTPVRDVIVVDPTEAPDDPDAITGWLKKNYIIGI